MKKVALLLAALMLAALFSGCGGDNSDEKWTAQDLAGKTVGVQIGAPGAFLALELAGKPGAGADVQIRGGCRGRFEQRHG